jgi:glycosyltransferase involved in cell wall biosynthesis
LKFVRDRDRLRANMATGKKRVLVFIVAYNAESTILGVLERIPALESYDVEVLLIDDASADGTYRLAEQVRSLHEYRHPLTVLANPINQGYGGNQKIGYQYAVVGGFDIVALLHGDGQYAPEMLPDLLAPIARGEADVVHGSRMLKPIDALRGGMPLYKFIGNKILTHYENLVLGSRLSEFHTGYKVYSVAALKAIPFDRNSNAFHFDTEIIIQWLRAGIPILEVPIRTHYGDEICRVNGLRYALDVARASTAAFLMRYSLLYRRNFDVQPEPDGNGPHESKLHFSSTHSQALADVPSGITVIDMGCGPGHVSAALRGKGCRVIGIDQFPAADSGKFDEFFLNNLNERPFPHPLDNVQILLALDVIEYLASPERFLDELRHAAQKNLDLRVIISTGNIGFVVTRLMLLLGHFNYNKRGILDLTHTRLFTFSSMRRLLEESGFIVEKVKGIPAPVPLVLKSRFWNRLLMGLQTWLIRVSRGLFSYQIYMVARPLATVPTLLEITRNHSQRKSLEAS